jgi:hypothetical protein
MGTAAPKKMAPLIALGALLLGGCGLAPSPATEPINVWSCG